LAPGILVAATGVGAGDLLTAGLAGSELGTVILWAAVAGALLKWFLNEGIARWQMATGTTLLEGWVHRLGGWVRWVFLLYLLIWSVFTGGALVNACGVAGAGLCAFGASLETAKIVWGIVHALVGLLLVWRGGFAVFERMMGFFIGVMFVTVVLTAALLRPDWRELATGLSVPVIPPGGGLWILGVLGGVGGTLTLLSYGYWIREKHRSGVSGVRACRIDLFVGYAMTGLFGVSMIVIGSKVEVSKGAEAFAAVAIKFADQLAAALGPGGRWTFLIGFWGAVFSSLLGVWQSVPYLFADFVSLARHSAPQPDATVNLRETRAYRSYLVALAIVPLPLLWINLRTAQLLYTTFGAMFMPLLALTLLLMNNREAWVGRRFRNGWITNLVLVATLVFFAFAAFVTARQKLGPLFGID